MLYLAIICLGKSDHDTLVLTMDGSLAGESPNPLAQHMKEAMWYQKSTGFVTHILFLAGHVIQGKLNSEVCL